MMRFSVNGIEYKSNEMGNYFYKWMGDKWKRISKAEWEEAVNQYNESVVEVVEVEEVEEVEQTKNEVAVVVTYKEPEGRRISNKEIWIARMLKAANVATLVMGVLLWMIWIAADTLGDPLADLADMAICLIVQFAVWAFKKAYQGLDWLLDQLLAIKEKVEPMHM